MRRIIIAAVAACVGIAGVADAQTRYFVRQRVVGASQSAAATTPGGPHAGKGCGLPSSSYAPSSTAGAVAVHDIYYPDEADQAASAQRACNKRMAGPGVCFLTPSSQGMDLKTVWYSESVTTVVPSSNGTMAINCNAK